MYTIHELLRVVYFRVVYYGIGCLRHVYHHSEASTNEAIDQLVDGQAPITRTFLQHCELLALGI